MARALSSASQSLQQAHRGAWHRAAIVSHVDCTQKVRCRVAEGATAKFAVQNMHKCTRQDAANLACNHAVHTNPACSLDDDDDQSTIILSCLTTDA